MNFFSTGSLVGVFARRVGLGKGPKEFWADDGETRREVGGDGRENAGWNGEHGCGISTIELNRAVFPQQIL